MTMFRSSYLRALKMIIPCLSACLIPCLSATPALATEAPRWDIISTSSPTNLQPNTPRNEVEDVAVDATGGTFTLGLSRHRCAETTTTPIPFDAGAAEVQAALEAVECPIGSGGVTVTGGPPGAGPYVVTFVGALSDEPLALVANGASLTGGAATATVTEVAHGAFPVSVLVTAINVGGASSDGSTITLADSLPPALSATGVSGYDAYASFVGFNGEGAFPMSAMSCSVVPTLTCSYSGSVDPGDMLVMRIPVAVTESLMPELNHATVSGGGAAGAAIEAPVTIGGTAAGFGPAPASVIVATSTNRAGAHANVTTAFTLNTSEPNEPAGQAKDIRFDTPPGLVGNTVGMARCSMAKIRELENHPNDCPADTMVGMALVTIEHVGGAGQGEVTQAFPVYNIAPAPGEPAAFAFSAITFPVRLDTSVLSNGDYGVRVTVPDITQAAGTLASSVTLWGVPADHSGPGSNGEVTRYGQQFGGPNPGQTRVPLLTNPQQCTEPLSASMSTDSWEHPGVFVSSGPVPMGTLVGCEHLNLESSFTMLPDTLEAGAPAGYTFNLNIPQRNEPDGLATPNVKEVKLTLPAGVVVNPSAAWGLKACSNTQFFGSGPREQQPAQAGNCPREAQVGKVRIKTPALEEAFEGEVYLAEPECDPCTPQDAQDGKMIRLFLQVVSEGEGGIVVKLEGHGSIDQATGQITTVFENNPQLPFSSLKLTLGGGPRAVLANPRSCGVATSNLDLTPWSTPFSADSTPFYEFDVNQGCFGPQFNPSFVAGLTNLQAGEYGPFTLSFGRSDQDQFLGGLELHMPPGLLGSLAHVPLCPEPQASQGTCPQQSLIGHTQVLTGPGADPFLVTGGQVFLTEGYKGAPFGLSIVVPAVAGPYTLSGTTGHGTVVVRAAISIDPHTAALTVRSDPLPTMLDGIPLQLKVVNVTIDRNEFTFGPTSCAKTAIAASLLSAEGATANVSRPFQVTNCRALEFKPKFAVSTSGKTSRANGASLHVTLTYPNTPQGTEANIRSVKVDLPKQLVSRLATLQKACLDSVFDQNPAACPAASSVGTAKATTPLLPVPLEGPAYFVSHGGAKFPELIVVLQGYGVTVDLNGETFINTAGITSSTFGTIPDVPVGTFELNLPEGSNSALAANGKLCQAGRTVLVGKRVKVRSGGHVRTVARRVRKRTGGIVMPTFFTAQNGAVIHQNTPVTVTGCPPARPKAGARKGAVKRRGR
jgi:hypothetical protein